LIRNPSAPTLVAIFVLLGYPSSIHASSLKVSIGNQAPSELHPVLLTPA
jgi:hypothetical protein